MQPEPLESAGKPAFRKIASNLYRRTSSDVYYALVKRGGKQFRKSLKTTDAALARRRLSDFRDEVGSLVSHDAGKMTFEIVADRWQASERHTLKESTALRRKCYVEAVTPFFAGLTLRNITATHCQRWLTERGDSIAPETFCHELGVMKAIFDFAKSEGLILRSPAHGIKRKRIPPSRIKVPSIAQFAELVAAIRAQAAARDGADLVELLAYSGCRLDEARQLRWENVAWPRGSEQGTLLVTGGERRTKNYEARKVPMTDALFGLLSRLHTERQPKPADCIVSIQSAKKCLATAGRKLGLPNFTHHTMRHFFATTCIEAGVDVPTVSRWLGHKDGGALAMRVYGHLRQEHSFAQIKRVNFGTATPSNVVSLPPASGASQAAAGNAVAGATAGAVAS